MSDGDQTHRLDMLGDATLLGRGWPVAQAVHTLEALHDVVSRAQSPPELGRPVSEAELPGSTRTVRWVDVDGQLRTWE